MTKFKELKEKFERLEELSEQDDYPEELDDLVYSFEEELEEAIDMDPYNYKLIGLKGKIKTFKGENGFYDEEAELDMMFPNRNDDDFNEEDMSYDSVFGGD